MRKTLKSIIAAILVAAAFTSAVPAAAVPTAAAAVSSAKTTVKTTTMYIVKSCYSYKTADGKGTKVKAYYKGAAVRVTGTKGSYYKLSDGSYVKQTNIGKKRINWTDSKYKSPIIRYAAKDNVKVRSGALGTSKVIDTLKKGAMLEIVAKTNSGYYKLKSGGYVLKTGVTGVSDKAVCKPAEHKFGKATCTAPATCEICGITTGTAAEHDRRETSVYTKGDDLYTEWTCRTCGYSGVDVDKNRVSAENVKKNIMAVQEKYPTGTPFTNENYYGWNGGIYSGGFGCAGFAFMVSDAAFGNLPARYIDDINLLRVGDIIRINNNTHSIIVTDIDGDTITVAEGNFNGGVYWGRTFNKSTLVFDYIMTRYSE